MSKTDNQLAACPVVVGINVDVAAIDVQEAGSAGLFGRYSYGRYGARVGIWRLLDALAENEAKATFFVMPSEIGKHPHVLQAMLDGGHEVAVRGYVRARAGEPETLDQLGRDRETLQRLTGNAPRGWRAANGLVTQATLPALAALGYAYDSSAQDDDAPYVMGSGGAVLVELPVFDYLTDAKFYTHRHTDVRVARAWAEEADAQYCAGGYVNLTLHTRGDVGSSRLPRVRMVADFLRDLAQRPGVAFYRAGDLAQAWRAAHSVVEPFPTMPKPQI
ncbi:polysaccharide deacetylase family protein [Bordetella sp. BOR01]|uniref:polysaccharide deacetylase family protein n=1 Tax=Bordetella sp. BOR01 TaxID=2854779 RepID=UPI001C4580B9|nr:polysaccharide deacetylase family protein [Bordetella sp. BOR01]MBV7486871.1 polysaccharide deacetylase family protein [Bordetella sp. BOR01]